MQNKLSQLLLPVLVFALPLFFWTLTPNYFSTSKLFVLLTVSLLIAIGFCLHLIQTKALHFAHSRLLLPLFVFMGSILLSLAFNPEGRPEAIAGKAITLGALPLLAVLLILTKTSASYLKKLVLALMASSVALSIYSLLQLTLISNLSFVPAFMQLKTFTPTGDYLTTLIIILVGVAAAISELSQATPKTKPYYMIVTILGAISAVAIVSLMLPGFPLSPQILPYQESWAITLDALKSLKTLFFGVGVANYSLLYTAVKPLSLNVSGLWNFLPQTGTSELLTLLATTGLLGGLSLIWLFFSAIKSATGTPIYLPILVIVLALIFTPGNILLYLIFFALISATPKEFTQSPLLKAKPAMILGVGAMVLFVTAYAYAILPIISEYYVGQAQLALKNNNGKSVYDFYLKAIRLSPRLTSYHLAFAEVNLNLAGALSQKSNLSDGDKTTISQLVQQAINESKTAISLEPNNSTAWLSLGKIYRNLVNVATGSETFAIDNYAKAVSLDPSNPMLRVDFGGLFVQLAQNSKDQKTVDAFYARAKSELQTAIQLKPDYANAYYNLAKVYENTTDYENSYLALQKTISLLGTGSPDLDRVTSELATIKAKLPQDRPVASPQSKASDKSTQSPSALATPTPLPSSLPGGPLEINQ